MTITHKIQMDLIHRGIVPRLSAVQGDALTRQVEISLRAEGKPWPVPGEPTVLLRYRRPDRITGEYDTLPDGSPAGHTDGSAVTVVLSREVLAVPGDVMLVVTLILGGRELSTFEFIITVQPNHSRDIFAGKDQASVTGMLPAPDAAKPGQILVIQEVDEYGLIRKMKADDALPGTTITQIALDESLSDEHISRYLITMNDNSVHAFEVNHGKSAYAYAREAGYDGTEAEFARKLASECTPIHIGEEAPEDEAVCLWIDTDEEALVYAPSDWNAAADEAGYIENRTHYSEIQVNEIFPESTVSWTADTEFCVELMISKPMVVGRQYRVTYNGTEYPLAAVFFDGSILIGNISLLDPALEDYNTGEPFVLLYDTATILDSGIPWLMCNEYTMSETPTEGSAAMKIIEMEEVVQKLDKKFIPATSYIITDVTNQTINESFDNFSDILWNGGTVYVRSQNSEGQTMISMVTSALWAPDNGSWTLCAAIGESVTAYSAANGTWMPPTE